MKAEKKRKKHLMLLKEVETRKFATQTCKVQMQKGEERTLVGGKTDRRRTNHGNFSCLCGSLVWLVKCAYSYAPTVWLKDPPVGRGKALRY